MGIFSRLFSNETDDQQGGGSGGDAQPASLLWASNAPAHWPALATEGVAPSMASGASGPAASAMDNLFFAAALKRLFEHREGLELAGVLPTWLTEKGVLELPMVVKDGDRLVAVVPLLVADTAAAERFMHIDRAMRRRGESPPIYLAPQPLELANGVEDLASEEAYAGDDELYRPLELEDLGQADERPGRYAMWWPGEDIDLIDSPFAKSVERFYRAADGLEPYILGFLLQSISGSDQFQPALLPESLEVIPVGLPENQVAMMSLSQEKGLRFHFDPTTTSAQYRDIFWRLMVEMVEEMRGALVRQTVQRIELDPRPVEWWHLALAAVSHAGEPIDSFGLVVIEG